MPGQRKVIHIDMDAFYASIEQRDSKELRGQAVAVGGSPEGRGVVAAASYEARRFGVRSAMPASQALRLCPSLQFVKPRIAYYKTISSEIMAILSSHTDLLEPLSLDEAYLDVTENKAGIASATEIAMRIRSSIFEKTQLTASAGVAPNKFLAKIASDMNKPDGITVIPPAKVAEVLATLPVRKVPGIGRVTEEKMSSLGIRTTGDLQRYSEAALVQLFGKVGRWYHQLSLGIDNRSVNPDRIRKSVSVEDTFEEDSIELPWLKLQIRRLSESLARRLARIEARGKTITLKVTYADFEKCTRSKTLAEAVADPATLEETACSLLHLTEAGQTPIRLLGIGVSNLVEPESRQPTKEGWQQLQLPFAGAPPFQTF